MELIIPITIYLLILTYIIAKQLAGLFKSKKSLIKGLTLAASAIFLTCLVWELIQFIRNEDGKSFTIGWFALIYFLAISFTVFAIVSWGLHLLERKI
jgi:UDP-N-acetylmuramyl pentapeptide phosphotransferase/UDP-N-acetylglucosamine-1-phosphate transferase